MKNSAINWNGEKTTEIEKGKKYSKRSQNYKEMNALMAEEYKFKG